MIVSSNYPAYLKEILREIENSAAYTFYSIGRSFYFPGKVDDFQFAVANNGNKNVCAFLNNLGTRADGNKEAHIPFRHSLLTYTNTKIVFVVYDRVETLNLHLDVQEGLREYLVTGNNILSSLPLWGQIEILKASEKAAFNNLINNRVKGAIRG